MKTFKLILFFTFFIGNIILSIYVFSNGFLIRRLSLSDTNSVSHLHLKKFNKCVILFIDALRFDFIFSKNSPLFGISTIEKLIQDEPNNAKLFKFIADPPTTTMQRIKALMTGSLPTFIDAGSNFDSYLIEDDNLIQQSYINNKSVVILGDDTWLSLFDSKNLKEYDVYPSFNIKDLDSNDISVDASLGRLFKQNSDWNLIIAHYLGLDHCGHTFGPRHPVLKRKLNDIDKTISYVADSIDNETLLVVIGDHGMTETGDHGGDSTLELESALFFYSKTPIQSSIHKKQTIDRLVFKQVRQINLTPTLALLFGVPIPFSNLGIVIQDMFEFNKPSALYANFIQMVNFIRKYESLTNEKFLDNKDYEELSDLTSANMNANMVKYEKYLSLIQEKCREKWSTFNTENCLLGLTLIFLSILVLIFLIVNYKSETFKLDYLSVFLQTVLLSSILYIFLYLILGLLIQISYILLLANGIILGHLIRPNVFKSIHFHIEYFLFFLSLLIPFSNSFIINENLTLRYILISLILAQFYSNLRHSSKDLLFKKFTFLVVLITIIRSTALFYVCREEVLVYNCTESYFAIQLSKISFENSISLLSYIFFIILNFSLILAVLVYNFNVKTCKNLNYLFIFQFLILLSYWSIQLGNSLLKDHSLVLHKINLYSARLFYILFFITQYKIRTNCYKTSSDKTIDITLSFGLLVSLVSGQSLLSIWLLILALEIYFKHIVVLNNKTNILKTSIVLVVFQSYFFYGTGHETTFTHIKWEAGFHGFEGDNNNPLIRIFIMVFILINTFSSSFIVSINSFGQLSSFSPSNSRALMLYCFLFSALKVFATSLSVYLLRRHLMVWKIFAPRFVFDAICFILNLFYCFLSLLLYVKN